MALSHVLLGLLGGRMLFTAAAVPGPRYVKICVSSYAGDCNCDLYTDTIQVKYCEGTRGDSDYYVYKLKNVPFCDMAYCAVKGLVAGMHFIELHALCHLP